MTWHLPGFTTMENFSLNRSTVYSLSVPNSKIKLDAVSANAVRVLTSAKLCLVVVMIKEKKRLLIDKMKRGPSPELRGTPDFVFSQSL